MSMVKWNMHLFIGIDSIDQNHKHLVQLLNEAYDEFIMGINIEEIFIEELFQCMAHCFDCEESLMIETSYPNLSAHKAEHEVFTERFLVIGNNYQRGADTSIEILMFLNNWINHHIRETDTKFGDFFEIQNLGLRILKSSRHKHRSGSCNTELNASDVTASDI